MNAIFRGMKADERVAIVETMEKRAEAAGLAETKLWQSAVDFWAPAAIVTSASLVAETIRFAAFLNEAGARTEQRNPIRPAGSVRRRAYVRKPRARNVADAKADGWSRGEVEKIWDAASALPQLHGVCFNALILVRHDLVPRDEAAGAREVSDLVHEAGQQLRRLDGAQSRFHYIYRHRRTAYDGFTTAIICHVPERWADVLLDWIEDFLERRCGSARDRRAFHVRLTEHRRIEDQFRRHWRLVRGLSGPLDLAVEVIHEGRRQRLADVLHVPSTLRQPGQPLSLPQRYRISETIGAGARTQAARDRMALLSPFGDQGWAALTNGWELLEYEERGREAEQRAQAVALIEAHWPAGRDERHDQVRQAELAKLRSSWSSDPRRRIRSWRGWWLPEDGLPD